MTFEQRSRLRSIFVSEISLSSRVIHAQSIEFGDRQSLAFVHFPTNQKNLAFLPGTMIPGVVRRYSSIATRIIFEISFQPEHNPNHLGFQVSGPSIWTKTLSLFFAFSVENGTKIS